MKGDEICRMSGGQTSCIRTRVRPPPSLLRIHTQDEGYNKKRAKNMPRTTNTTSIFSFWALRRLAFGHARCRFPLIINGLMLDNKPFETRGVGR